MERKMTNFFRVCLGASCVMSCVAYAFPCYLTIVKDNCWTNYDLTVTIANLATKTKLGSVLVPKGKLWGRQQFSCEAGQTLTYEATFQPIIWESQANLAYQAVSFWNLPKAVGAHDLAWNLTACFPKDFSGVPTPPTATSHCSCDTSTIPAPNPTAPH